MQIKLLFRLMLVVMPFTAAAQSTYIRTGSLDYPFIDRLEIKTRSGELNQSFVKPFSRKKVFAAIDSISRDTIRFAQLSKVDKYNIYKLITDPEWNPAKGIYQEVNQLNFRTKGTNGFWMLNPVARIEYSKESNNNNNPFIASVGIDTRGVVFKKVGFNLFATANTERLPSYLGNWMSRYRAVPGIGDYRTNSNGKVSYLDIRGSVQTSVTRFIDLQLGYDRLFLGNGHRSLFLSDFSNNAAFFKINAKIWKINLQSLYIKLAPQDGIVNKPDTKKFLRINSIGIDATKWLNISVFDAVVFGRENGFDLNYILPLTFLRAMEQQSGSPDNALFGVNVKANIAGRAQVYVQGLLDEFKLNEIRDGNGWWANKFGYQLGAKYIDAFGIKNLDLQAETNRIRPFTYTHFDSVSNYSHSSQPLAHPLGASLHEFVGLIRYQPINKLLIHAKAVYYTQGLDSLGRNTGNNVLINYNTRSGDYGWEVGKGDKATCFYVSGTASYEVYGNLFVDASVLYRNFKTELGVELNTTMVSLGLRWNIGWREFDF